MRGALAAGKNPLRLQVTDFSAVVDGYLESAQSWLSPIRSTLFRGLRGEKVTSFPGQPRSSFKSRRFYIRSLTR
jgi:hypothetical protein